MKNRNPSDETGAASRWLRRRRPVVWGFLLLVVLAPFSNAQIEKIKDWLWLGENKAKFDPYPRVTIYDSTLDAERGIRVALQPYVENEENLAIDLRITQMFQSHLRTFCDDVVTVPDVEDIQLRNDLDDVLRTYLYAWRTKGEVDPSLIQPLLPKIDVDATVFIARTRYEQGWQGDRKVFRIELVGGAFAVDTGLLLWQDKVVIDEEWSGSESTSERAEYRGTYELAGKFHATVSAIAEKLRQRRAAKLAADQAAADQAQQTRNQAAAAKDNQLAELVHVASEVLKSATEPVGIINDIRAGRNWMIDNLKVPGPMQSDELLKARAEVEEFLIGSLEKWWDWYQAEQQRIAALPKDTPIAAPGAGSEEPREDGLLIDFGVLKTPTPNQTAPDVPRPFDLSQDQVARPVPPTPTPTRFLIRSELIMPPTPTITPTPTEVIPTAPPTLPPEYYYPNASIKGPQDSESAGPVLNASGGITAPDVIDGVSKEVLIQRGRNRAWSLMTEQNMQNMLPGANVDSATGTSPDVLMPATNSLQELLERRRASRREMREPRNIIPMPQAPTSTPTLPPPVETTIQ